MVSDLADALKPYVEQKEVMGPYVITLPVGMEKQGLEGALWAVLMKARRK